MLPGFVLGGNSIAAFFKLSDGVLEPLPALCLGGIIWSTTAYIFCQTAIFIRRAAPIYYPAIAASALLYTLAAGGVAICCGNGLAAASTGIAVSALSTALIAHSFVSTSYTFFDRLCFTAGGFAAAAIWFTAGIYSRLAWMETLFFYSAIFLLLSWAFASPLTQYGKSRKKWLWRLLLLTGAWGSFYTVPVFSPPPKTFKNHPEKLWSKTNTTCNGRRFILQEKSGRYGYYTPRGKLLAADRTDEKIQSAVLPLLSLPENTVSAIQLIAPATSVLPGLLKNHTEARLRHHRVPETIYSREFKWNNHLFSQILPNRPTSELPHKSADILLITALPENPYPYFLQRWLKYIAGDILHPNGIAAIPADLLKNPAVFNFMHENFACSGILPGSGELWVFSHHPVDLSLKSISKKMQQTFSSSANINPEMFEIVYSNSEWLKDYPAAGSEEHIAYGTNQLCGSWWWWLFGAAAAVVWRVIRLFGERRSTMYSCFNAIENGFSGMGVFLLSLSLLLVYSGAYTIFLASAAGTFVFLLTKWKCGGIWAAVTGLLVLPVFLCNDSYNFLMVIIMLQAVALTGAMPSLQPAAVGTERQLLCAVFLGMLFAGWLIAVLWLGNIPLLPVWGLFLLARLPGIWQYGRKSVYYSNNDQQ